MRKGIETVVRVMRVELRHEADVRSPVARVGGPDHIVALAMPLIGARAQEAILLGATDTRLRPLAVGVIGIGTAVQADLDMAALFRFVLSSGATRFFLAHNHPSGSVEPSPEDERLTADVASAAGLMRVAFIDHVIVGPRGRGYSFRMARPDLFEPWENTEAPNVTVASGTRRLRRGRGRYTGGQVTLPV